jgi:hypothetical protein
MLAGVCFVIGESIFASRVILSPGEHHYAITVTAIGVITITTLLFILSILKTKRKKAHG